MDRGNSFFVREKFEDAIKWYGKVINDSDNSVEDIAQCRLGLSKCYLGLKNHKKAKESFTVLLESNFADIAKRCLDEIDHILNPPKPKVEKKKKSVSAEIAEKKARKETWKEQIPPELPEEKKSSKTFRDTWLESALEVQFTMYCKKLKKEQVKVYIQENTLTVDIELVIKLPKEEKTLIYRRVCNLTKPILPSESSFELTEYKLIVNLRKAENKQWGMSFEAETSQTKNLQNTHEPWKKRQQKYAALKLDDDDDKEEKDDPNSAMMNLMKKLYTDGDDDMKRMINKSWVEGKQKKKD